MVITDAGRRAVMVVAARLDSCLRRNDGSLAVAASGRPAAFDAKGLLPRNNGAIVTPNIRSRKAATSHVTAATPRAMGARAPAEGRGRVGRGRLRLPSPVIPAQAGVQSADLRWSYVPAPQPAKQCHSRARRSRAGAAEPFFLRMTEAASSVERTAWK